jgi:hypothetical protein
MIELLPIAYGLSTDTSAHPAGHAKAKIESSKGRQFLPSRPQLCALGLHGN